MSHNIKSKTATPAIDEYKEEAELAEIIPWPDIEEILKKREKKEKKKIRLEQKYLYYKGKKIPILHFQKAGYEKLLKLLVKEIER